MPFYENNCIFFTFFLANVVYWCYTYVEHWNTSVNETKEKDNEH